MKKILTAITTITLLASLTACVYVEKTPIGSNSESVSQNSETNSDTQQTDSQDQQNSDNSTQETESRTERLPFELRSTDEGFKEKLELFNLPDLTLPNGEMIKKEDADFVHGYGDLADYIGFDSVYLYKAKPYFRSTIDEPNMINWDTLEVTDDPGEFTDHEYFKIKAGDTLDNGLKVKSAEFWYGRILNEHYVDISFDGELTLEGILYRTPEDEYGSNKGDLHFFPNTAKNDFFSSYSPYSDDKPGLFADNVNKFAVNYDYYTNIRLGNETEAPSGVSEILGDSAFAKVKVTITDLRFRSTTMGTIPNAAIKNIAEL